MIKHTVKFTDSKEENETKKRKKKKKEINFVLEFLPFHVLILPERIIIEKQLVL